MKHTAVNIQSVNIPTKFTSEEFLNKIRLLIFEKIDHSHVNWDDIQDAWSQLITMKSLPYDAGAIGSAVSSLEFYLDNFVVNGEMTALKSLWSGTSPFKPIADKINEKKLIPVYGNSSVPCIELYLQLMRVMHDAYNNGGWQTPEEDANWLIEVADQHKLPTNALYDVLCRARGGDTGEYEGPDNQCDVPGWCREIEILLCVALAWINEEYKLCDDVPY